MKALMYPFAALATMAAIAPLTVPVRADMQADRASLLGSWVQSGGSNAWIINSDPNGIHIVQIKDSGTVADFQCNLEGRDCDVKIAGHKASVSLYYNGSALVQLETIGDQITKRRFSVLASGNSMKVEITPMTSHVQTEELDFERGQPVTRKK